MTPELTEIVRTRMETHALTETVSRRLETLALTETVSPCHPGDPILLFLGKTAKTVVLGKE